MTRVQLVAVFVACLAVALILTLPLALVLPNGILSARAATGTIWSGTLTDARVGRLALGNLHVSVNPFALMTGKVRATVTGRAGRGVLTSGHGIADATAHLSVAGLFTPVPLSGIHLDNVTAEFRDNRCERADGRVRAVFSGDVAGLALAQGLSGAARCEGGEILLPLASQSAMERLNLRISADGNFRSEFIVKSTDVALNAKLLSAGFQSTQGGYALRLTGKL